MRELVHSRADGVFPGDTISLGGTPILVTAVDTTKRVVDLHTEYGPALRFLRSDLVALVVGAADSREVDAAA